MGGTAPLFHSKFGIDSGTFGIIWGSMAIAYVAGSTMAARLTPKIGTDALMRFAIWGNLIAGILLVISTSVGTLTPTKLLFPIALLMGLTGMITPGALAGAVREHAKIAGTAAGLSSAIGLVLTGLFTLVSGGIYDGSFGPTAWLMFDRSSKVRSRSILPTSLRMVVCASCAIAKT